MFLVKKLQVFPRLIVEVLRKNFLLSRLSSFSMWKGLCVGGNMLRNNNNKLYYTISRSHLGTLKMAVTIKITDEQSRSSDELVQRDDFL